MAKGESFTLNTKGSCFFCLEQKTRKDKEQAPVGQTVSLKLLSRFLDLSKVFQIRRKKDIVGPGEDELTKSSQETSTIFRGKRKDVEIFVELCPECSEVLEEFSGLYRQQEVIELRLAYCVRKLEGIVEKSSGAPDIVRGFRRRMTKTEDVRGGLIWHEMVTKLRAAALVSFKTKSRIPYPELKLKKLKVTRVEEGVEPQLTDALIPDVQISGNGPVTEHLASSSRTGLPSRSIAAADASFKCDVCIRKFSNLAKLRKHKLVVHRKKAVQGNHSCLHCKASFFSEATCRLHLIITHPFEALSSELPCVAKEKFAVALSHIMELLMVIAPSNSEREGNPLTISCGICAKIYSGLMREELKSHIMLTHNPVVLEHLRKELKECESQEMNPGIKVSDERREEAVVTKQETQTQHGNSEDTDTDPLSNVNLTTTGHEAQMTENGNVDDFIITFPPDNVSTPEEVLPFRCTVCSKMSRTFCSAFRHILALHRYQVLVPLNIQRKSKQAFKSDVEDLFNLSIRTETGRKAQYCCSACDFSHREPTMAMAHFVSKHLDQVCSVLMSSDESSPASVFQLDTLLEKQGTPIKISASVRLSESLNQTDLAEPESSPETLPEVVNTIIEDSPPPSPKENQCQFCQQTLPDASKLEFHLVTLHRPELLGKYKEPNITSFQFSSAVSHVIQQNRDDTKCKLCQMRYLKFDECERHIIESHLDKIGSDLVDYQRSFLFKLAPPVLPKITENLSQLPPLIPSAPSLPPTPTNPRQQPRITVVTCGFCHKHFANQYTCRLHILTTHQFQALSDRLGVPELSKIQLSACIPIAADQLVIPAKFPQELIKCRVCSVTVPHDKVAEILSHVLEMHLESWLIPLREKLMECSPTADVGQQQQLERRLQSLNPVVKEENIEDPGIYQDDQNIILGM